MDINMNIVNTLKMRVYNKTRQLIYSICIILITQILMAIILHTSALAKPIKFSSGEYFIESEINNDVLFSADGSLVASQGVDGSIKTSVDSTGTITIGDGDVTGPIGTKDGKLKQVVFNGVSNVTSIDATTVTVNSPTANVTAAGLITGAVSYTADGALISNEGITGNVDFAGNEGILQLADGKTIKGDVNNIGPSAAGKLEFLGRGTVTGTIGASKPLTTIGASKLLTTLKFSGAGESKISAARAETIEVANGGSVVTATDTVTADILFSKAGILAAQKGIFGNVLFSADGSLVASQGVDGSIKTSVDSTGTITIGDGDVTGPIGTKGGKLKQVVFNGVSNVTSIDATTVTVNSPTANVTAAGLITGAVSYTADGALISNEGITGNVDFAGNEGILQLADGKTIKGDVNNIGPSAAGKLEFLGRGTVTGTIGASKPLTTIGASKLLTTLKFSGAGESKISAARAETIEVANGGSVVTATDTVTADILFSKAGILAAQKGIFGNVLFSADGSLVASQGVDGSIKTSVDSTGTITIGDGDVTGPIGTKGGKLKQVVFNGVSNVTSIDATTVTVNSPTANVTAAGLITGAVSYTADGALISNEGITGNVDFAGNEGILQLADGKTIKGDVNNIGPSAAGKLEFLGRGTVTGTIGASKLLTTLKFSGAGESKISAARAETIEVANGGSVVTATDTVTADILFSKAGILAAQKGIFGNVLFSADGSLVASQGVDGSIKTSVDSTGTITIGDGDVTGPIGTKDGKLKQVVFNGVSNVTSIDATTVTVNSPTANVTAAGLITGAVSYTADGALISNEGITGNVDFAGNEGILQLADGKTIKGDVKSNGGNSGVINFEGQGSINGSVRNLTMLKAGAGDITFTASGDYSITELQGNGDRTVIFPSGMQYIGGINITGGNPVNLSFADNNTITGNIGSNSSPVGNISSGTNTGFNGDINSSGDVITSGATVFAGDITCNNLIANKTKSNKFSSITLLSVPLTTSRHNMMNFDQDNVITEFQGMVHTKGDIEVSDSTYFADTVNSQGNITINGDTKFNNTLSSGNNIDIASGLDIIFNGNVNAKTINVDSSNIKVSDNISIAGNISVSNSNIILDNNTLTLSGNNIFANQIIINTTYDESSLSGGNIILTPSSTLDLSNVSELVIKLSFINSDISKIADDTKYTIILAEDGSTIVPLKTNQIILDSSGEQNKFVKWKLDANSLTLYAYDDSDYVIDTDDVFDSVQDNSNALEFRNNIGLLDKEHAEEMLSRILDHPKERDSAILQVALHQTLIDINKVAMNAIHNRLSNTGSVISQAAIAAGDDNACGCNDTMYEENRYGMWARSSINHSKDKVSGKNAEYFSSYKTKGHSNTIGFDGLICDNILLGAAYTNSYTSIRPKDQNIGNIDKVRTNLFSLYSAYNIPNYNWYLNSTISYAESSIRSGKTRYLAIAKNVLDSEVASSKYKSHLYSGSVSLGYNHSLGNNAYVIPSIGAIGSLIRDKGYTETGTSFQNLTVHKKNDHKLSSMLGLRAYQDISFGYLGNVDNASSLIITPEAYGFVNYNIKNKYARMQGIEQRLPTINYRSNKVDYNLGLGITIKHHMMEYSINYDANLAKKYQSHTGSIKVRANF